MKTKYDVYNQENLFDSYDLDDKISLAKDLVKEANKKEKIIENNPDVLKDIIDMDLRENVPPQIYEVISCIVDVIIKAENS